MWISEKLMVRKHFLTSIVLLALSLGGTELHAQVTFGKAVVTIGSCPPTAPGSSSDCSPLVASVTAVDGPIILASNTFLVRRVGGDASHFTFSSSGITNPRLCRANTLLEAGQSCDFFYVRFVPQAPGTFTLTIDVQPQSGTAGAGYYTGSTPSGTATLNSIGCGNTGVGTQTNCTGTIAVTANGGSIVLGSTPYSVSGATSHFTYAPASSGACLPGQTLAAGASCNLITVSKYNPSSAGTHTMTVSVTPTSGTAGSGTVSGSASFGTAIPSVSGVTCSSTVGIAATCSGTARITASGGQIVLNATPITKSGSHAGDFTIPAGACGGATLAPGMSCNLGTITFTPGGSGTRSVTLTSSVASGTNGSATLAGTGVASGTATVSSVSCDTAGIGTTKTCSGTVTLTATGGAIQLGSTVYSTSGSTSEFTTSAPSSNACTAGQLLASGASCNLLTVTQFKPTAVGARSMTISAISAIGAAGSGTVSGTGVYGSVILNPSSLACDSIGAGLTTNCGSITVTASGGQVRFESPALVLSNATHFELVEGTCTGNKVLNAGESCTTGQITFRPQSVGAQSATISVKTLGDPDPVISLSGTGLAGSVNVNPTSIDCGAVTAGGSKSCGLVTLTAAGGPITFTATPVSASADFTVTAGTCTANSTLAVGQSCATGVVVFNPTTAGAKSGTLSINCGTGCSTSVALSGISYSYTWNTGDWGICTGGSAVWNTSPWTPASGCGNIEQTRTAACVAVSNSGSQSRSVICRRSDGAPVDDAFCGESKPSGTQSCTPTSFSCGPEPATSQTVLLTNSCTYTWDSQPWSAWSSTCSENATRTRDVLCKRSDGAIVPDEQCEAANRPADSETAEVLTSCTYTWIEGGFDACEGGSGSWLTGEWGPTMACGAVEQTRTVTCAFVTGSGTHRQAVSCRRSDGAIRPDEECDAESRPPTVENCTPVDVAVCGERPAETRTVTLDTSCAQEALLAACERRARPDQFCVATPL